MAKLVNIYIDGNFDDGFSVRAEIREDNARSPVSSERAIASDRGRLPAAPHLRGKISSWYKMYKNVVEDFPKFALKRNSDGFRNEDEAYEALKKATADLKSSLNGWLEDPAFRTIDSWLRNHLKADEEIWVLLQTDNHWLRKLPWQEWTLIRDFPEAEVALSSPKFKGVKQVADSESKKKTKILVILGYFKKNQEAEAIEKQVQEIEELAQQINAEVTWLHQPQRRNLDEPLWRKKWDIIFYAGHGDTSDEGQVGKIKINKEDWLKVSDIKNHLKRAINHGLKLAIFNACDGLGLAYQLADGEDLHLPQVIVMRDVLPVPLAPLFLKYFLEELTQGKSLYAAVREARRRLHIHEDKYPCASWLPVICQNPAENPLTWQMLVIPPCPYRGLRAFGEEHAPFFFGREVFTKSLGEAVRKKQLVAVIGASGSGKSSVVFAGLIPRLREKGNWQIVSFRPGKRPFESLAAALLPLTGDGTGEGDGRDKLDEIQQLADELQLGVGALKDVVESIVRPDSRRLLLVADQFEELYTLCPDKEEQQHFLNCLLKAVKDAACFTLLITLRADFCEYATSYRPFADALQGACQILGPMKSEELEDAIVLPAEKENVQLQEGLKERLINELDVAGNNLPLLAFTLEQLWYKQKNGQLTYRAYDEIGGVEESLGNHAENVYKQLSESDRTGAQRVFVQLIQPGEGTQDTRRLATRADVGEENWDLVTRLASEEARLVVTDRNQVGEETVEIVHEALISGWGRLEQWMEGDREFRRWQEGLRAKRREWEEKEHDEGILLRGVPLGEAEGWLQERKEEIARDERDFVHKSLELRDREQQQRKRLQRRIIGGLTAGLAVASSLAGIATWQWRLSERRRLTAESEGLALSALQQFESGGGEIEALVSAMEAGQKLRTLVKSGDISEDYPTNRPLSVLQTILSNIREKNQFIADFSGVTSVSVSQDGKLIATGGVKDGAVRIWNTSGKLITKWETHNKELYKIRFSPNGKFVATLGGNGDSSRTSVSLWDIYGKKIAELQVDEKDMFSSLYRDFSFSPDGKMIATAVWDNVRLWNMSGEEIAKLHSEDLKGVIISLSFSSDGQKIATGVAGGFVEVWDVKERKIITRFRAYSTQVDRSIFSTNSNQIITIGFDRIQGTIKGDITDTSAMRIWDLSGNLIGQKNYGNRRLADAIFSPDENKLVVVGGTGLIQLWHLSRKISEQFDGHIFPVNSVSFTPDGKQIVTAGRDGTVRLWNISKKQVTQLAGHQESIASMQFSQDGKQITTASDTQVRVWSRLGKLTFHYQDSLDERVIRIARPTPNGNRFLTVGRKGAALYDLSGKLFAELKTNFSWPYSPIQTYLNGEYIGDRSFSSSHDGQCIGTIGNTLGTDTQIWDFSRKNIFQLQAPDNSFLNSSWLVRTSHDCRYILNIGLSDRIARIWNNSGQLISQLDGINYFSEEHKKVSGIGVRLMENTAHITEIFKDSPAMKAGLKANDLITKIDGKPTFKMKTSDIYGILNGEPGTQVKLTIYRNKKFLNLSIIREKVKITFPRNTYTHAEFSPDSKYVATWVFEGSSFDIWNLSGEKIAELNGHQKGVGLLYFSSDSNLIATSDKSNLVRVWTRSGELITELQLTAAPLDIKFSPDSKLIATIEGDTVSLWNLSGTRIIELENSPGDKTWLSFSPDGQYLAAASRKNRITVWHVVGLDGLLAQGCNWLKDYLSTHPETKEKLTVCQYESILAEAEKFLEIDRDIEQSAINFQIQLGKDLAAAGNFEEAVAHFQKALELDPSLDIDPEAEARGLAP